MTKFHMKPNKFVTEIHLKVENIDRSNEFYQDIMGFRVLEEKDRIVILTADGITPIITIEQPEDVITKIPRRTGLYHFAILLPSRLQLGLFLKHIISKKYPITGGSNHGVSEAIYLEDPDDNGIEIYVDTNPSSWRSKNHNIEMVNKPLDYEGLIAEAGELEWRGMPAETIIGHIHLHIADLKQARKFYVDGLGFDLVMEMQNSALFLSSGGYHHHIGLNIWNGKGALPLPDNSAGMEYYTMMFPDVETRSNTVNDLKKLGYQVIEEDNKIFAKDPSDNLIKLII